MARLTRTVFLLLVLAGFASAQGPIEVGMSAAFSGSSRGLGIELYRGSMAFLQEWNAGRADPSKTVVIRAYDDRYEPDLAIRNTIRLIQSDQVLLLVNYVGTPTVTRVLPLLMKFSDLHWFLFFPFTGAQPQRQPPYEKYVFNLRASYGQETAGLVQNFLKIGRNRIAVFYQIDAYGRSGWEGVRNELSRNELKIVSEATYRRGTGFDQSMMTQVEILRREDPDAVISVGAYAACAAFIRDARDAGWQVPIANVSFVGSENLLLLLGNHGKKNGRDYSQNLINSQVVPSYEDLSLPAVRDYRRLMDRYRPEPPKDLMKEPYTPLQYGFVSFEGYLNARLLTEILERMKSRDRSLLRSTVENLGAIDLGIGIPVVFGQDRHQALDRVYYTTVIGDKFYPVKDWTIWKK